ncbi:MAG TPA: hypothetical protein VGD42_20385 [Lysobacter sp.]
MHWKPWSLVAVLAIGVARAQSPSMPAPDTPAVADAAPASVDAAPPACRQLCAGQVVEIELLEPVSSQRHHNGDRFRLQLAEPLSLDGTVVVPAGTPGIGEVVHASSSRAGGKPGELLLAARHLELAGASVPLRAMKLTARGKEEVNAALATAVLVGPIAMFVHGREIEVPAGTRAQAKLARDIDAAQLAARAATPPPAQATDEVPTTEPPHPTTQDTTVSPSKEQ